MQSSIDLKKIRENHKQYFEKGGWVRYLFKLDDFDFF